MLLTYILKHVLESHLTGSICCGRKNNTTLILESILFRRTIDTPANSNGFFLSLSLSKRLDDHAMYTLAINASSIVPAIQFA